MTRTLAAVVIAASALTTNADAQVLFGFSCVGASRAEPTIAASGIVKSGQTWTLQVTAQGGIGLGYLAIGFSNTTASAFGGLPLPIELGAFFADPLWSGCSLLVDPSYALQPYFFDPNVNGGLKTFTLPGFDFGKVYLQAINVDPDFVTRIAGMSQGLEVRPTAPTGMVAIQPGTFLMGSNAPITAPYFDGQDDNIEHAVTISYPFWMAQHEVTQAEYEAVMGSNPSFSIGPNRPVERVSWFDARAYCTALTVAETLAGNVPAGYEFRLPTEAEWEYACRAGSTTEFNLGPGLLCNQAAFSYSQHSQSSCGTNGTVDVGSYAPNDWGLYDMHGNVVEWCLDSYENYESVALTDPFVTGSLTRVARGGSWAYASNYCRSADRQNTGSFVTSNKIGFRVVFAPVLVP